jgi:hypothetical protein
MVALSRRGVSYDPRKVAGAGGAGVDGRGAVAGPPSALSAGVTPDEAGGDDCGDCRRGVLRFIGTT